MKTICIDIDGTICEYNGWKGEEHFGKVLPNAKEMIDKLYADGWFIILHSTRSNKQLISDFMNANDIPFSAINENPYQPKNAEGGKPLADVYLDDRAINFSGDWIDAYNEIVNFETWGGKKPE